VTVDYLLGLSDDKSPPANTIPQSLRHLLLIARELSTLRQEELVRIAKTLAELERERATRVLTVESMRALLAASDKLEGSVENEELIAALQVLVRDMPAGWIVDLQAGQDATDQPAQSE
jgi:hypothetical protein